MIAVIQCAASKRSGAGYLASSGGKPVIFVADPETAPADSTHIYAKPDDPCGTGMSWRDVLLKYNETPHHNTLGLYPAYQLYSNPAYERLVDCFGSQKVYILSAGWGLIKADFLTPYYDITFSPSATGDQKFKRRKQSDRYHDFSMLPADTHDPVFFFGSKEYVPLFCSLALAPKSTRTVFYNAKLPPQVTGCVLKRFETTTRTNWHYECVKAFLDGKLDPG